MFRPEYPRKSYPSGYEFDKSLVIWGSETKSLAIQNNPSLWLQGQSINYSIKEEFASAICQIGFDKFMKIEY